MNQVQDMTFDEWSQLLGVEITSGYMMLFTLKPTSETELTSFEKEKWYNWLKKTLKSIVVKHEIMVGAIMDTQVPVLFLCKISAEKNQFRTNAETIIENLYLLFKKKT